MAKLAECLLLLGHSEHLKPGMDRPFNVIGPGQACQLKRGVPVSVPGHDDGDGGGWQDQENFDDPVRASSHGKDVKDGPTANIHRGGV